MAVLRGPARITGMTTFDSAKHPRTSGGRFTETARAEAPVALPAPTSSLWEEREAALSAASAATQELLAAHLAELGYSTLEAEWTDDPEQPNRRVCGEAIRLDGTREDVEGEDYWVLDSYLADLTSAEDLLETQDGPDVVEITAVPGDVAALTERYEQAWKTHAAAQKAALSRSWDELRHDVQTVAAGTTRLVVENLGDEYRVRQVGAVAVIEADGNRRELTFDEQDLLDGHLSYLTGYSDPLPYADENSRLYPCEVDVTAERLPLYAVQEKP